MYRVNFIHVIWKIKQCLNKYRSYSLECFRDDSSNLNVAQPCRDISMKAGDSLNSMLEKCSVQKQNSDTFRSWQSQKLGANFLFFVYSTGDKLNNHRNTGSMNLGLSNQVCPCVFLSNISPVQSLLTLCAFVGCTMYVHVPNCKKAKDLATV